MNLCRLNLIVSGVRPMFQIRIKQLGVKLQVEPLLWWHNKHEEFFWEDPDPSVAQFEKTNLSLISSTILRPRKSIVYT